MGITDYEIGESRKKLDIKADKVKKHKTTLCQANRCSKYATDTVNTVEEGSVETSNLTYFVLEIAPFFPYGR
jgi:hypothetical protein